MENNIELELRAEVSLSRFKELLIGLNKKRKLLSCAKRLSVMFLGKINQISFDIRVRIDSDGKAELAVKKGNYHIHNRIESSQEIKKNQFVGIVKIFSLLGFQSKVTERENYVFDLGNNITMTLVKAKSIAYVEIEKMSRKKNIDKNKIELLEVISDFNLKLIKDGEEFNNLCNRLTRYCDWTFNSSASHIKKLKTILKSY